jgi:uncharacterized protein YjiS (DUF1127 family)
MSTVAFSPSHGRLAGAGVVKTAWVATIEALALGAERLLTASRRRRDAEILSAMDDHQLRDIGISRSEISRAVRFGRAAIGR